MPHEILIYDEIGEFGVNARDVVNALKATNGEDVTVLINSPGGDVSQGLAIYNALKSHPGHVTTYITGVAFSMASGIAMAGDRVVMAANAVMMIHEPQAYAAGDELQMNRTAKMLASTRDALIVAYAEKSGIENSRIEALMREETWLSANEALELGLVDEIGQQMAVAAKFTLPDSIRVPAPFVENVSQIFSNVPPESSGTNSISEDDMAESKAEPKEVAEAPATLDQLLSLNGADDSFAVSQMKNKATLVQAQDALNRILLDKLTAAEKRAEELAQNVAKAKEEAASAADAGHEPVPGGSNAANEWTDPRDTFERLLIENKAKGLDGVRAYVAINRKHPGLIAAVRASA